MAGRDERLRLMRESAQARREREALAEVTAAAAGMQDARELNDKDLMRHAARRGARVDPELLPERWSAWVRNLRHAFAALEAASDGE